jgi:hypothetical protein
MTNLHILRIGGAMKPESGNGEFSCFLQTHLKQKGSEIYILSQP